MDRGDDDPADPATAVSYYYADGGRPPLGPVTIPQLKVLWLSGHVSRATSLWREGMPAWAAIESLPDVHGPLALLQQPPHDSSSTVWYYMPRASAAEEAVSQRRGGTTAQMGALFRRGEIDGLTHVWREGMAQWAELGSVDELRAQLVQAHGNGDEADVAEEARRAAMEAASREVAYDPDDDGGGGGGKPAPAPSSGHPPTEDAKAAKRAKRPAGGRFVSKAGTNVYVSGLPTSDVSVEEIAQCFKVAGVLKTDPDTGAPKVRLYQAADGALKGDALLSFLKAESVQLAVTLRDGFEFRPGSRLSVQPARFEKREQPDGGGGGGGKEAARARKRQRLREQHALADWDPGLVSGRRTSSVILRGLFDASIAAEAEAEADGGAAFYANLREDVRAECAKAGAIEKVAVFEGTAEGVCAVKFKRADDAERCVAMMDARSFGSQGAIRCEMYDGVTDYRAAHKRPGGAAGAAGGGETSREPSRPTGTHAAAAAAQEDGALDAYAAELEAESTDDEEW